MNKRTFIIISSFCLIIQVYDIHTVLLDKNRCFNQPKEYISSLTNTEFWNEIAENNEIKHIVYVSPADSDCYSKDIMYSITEWALNNGKTVNDFYFARSISESVEENKKHVLQTLPDDTIFIFPNTEKINCEKYNLHYYEIDNLIVGYVKSINDYKELANSDLITEWSYRPCLSALTDNYKIAIY